jgi:hypothetical protein
VVGNTVYFLSDREGPRTLFAYDTMTQKVARLIVQPATVAAGTTELLPGIAPGNHGAGREDRK